MVTRQVCPYAEALAVAAARPAVILRWPDNWTVEDVVGWILEGDAAAVASLAGAIAPPPATIAELVNRLKSEDRAAHGLKQDQIAYEAVADVIGSTEGCCRRARELLNAITDVVLGNDSPQFIVALGESVARPDFPTMTLFAVEGVAGSGKTVRLMEILGETLAVSSASGGPTRAGAHIHARREAPAQPEAAPRPQPRRSLRMRDY